MFLFLFFSEEYKSPKKGINANCYFWMFYNSFPCFSHLRPCPICLALGNCLRISVQAYPDRAARLYAPEPGWNPLSQAERISPSHNRHGDFLCAFMQRIVQLYVQQIMGFICGEIAPNGNLLFINNHLGGERYLVNGGDEVCLINCVTAVGNTWNWTM